MISVLAIIKDGGQYVLQNDLTSYTHTNQCVHVNFVRHHGGPASLRVLKLARKNELTLRNFRGQIVDFVRLRARS